MTRKSLSTVSRVAREDMPGSPDWIDPLLRGVNEFLEQATERLDSDLLTGVHVTDDFKHGVEKIIKNPFGARMPVGIQAVRCRGLEVDTAGKSTGKFYGLSVATVEWREVQSRADDVPRVGVTVFYAAPYGVCSLTRNAAYNAVNNANTATPFDTSEFEAGNLYYDSTVTGVRCRASGIVFASFEFSITANATGLRRAFLAKNGVTSEVYGYTQHPTSSAVNQGLTGSGLISVIAGDYLQMFYMQNSGGVLAVVLTDKRTRMDAHYTDPAITTKGRVTLRFEGGN